MGSRIRSQLLRQLGFLHRSCSLFDLGFEDEAIRIATCIRVLAYDKSQERRGQGSLLKHFGALGVPLRSTVSEREPEGEVLIYDGFMQFVDGGQPAEMLSCLGHRDVSIKDWWSEILFVTGGKRVSRLDLILTAANKDGGAHVDADVTGEYEAVQQMWTRVDEDGKPIARFDTKHLHAIRRCGYEILNSEAILSLAGVTRPSDIVPDNLMRYPPEASSFMTPVGLGGQSMLYGMKAMEDGHFLIAAEHARQAILSFHLILERLHNLRGVSLSRADYLHESLRELERAATVAPHSVLSLCAAASAAYLLADFSLAEQYNRRALEIDPTNVTALRQLGDLAVWRGEYDAAINYFDRALASEPADEITRVHHSVAVRGAAGKPVVLPSLPVPKVGPVPTDVLPSSPPPPAYPLAVWVVADDSTVSDTTVSLPFSDKLHPPTE